MYTKAKYLNFTVEQYLKLELESQIRHEYIAGQLYAIAKVSEEVKIITNNIETRLRTHLIGSNYRIFSSDMKLKIEPLDIFYYPEISVTNNYYNREKYFQTRPCLIVEVITPTTERIDRNEKLMNYRQIASLQEYVLVSQSEVKVDIYRKDNKNKWFFETLQAEDVIKFASVSLEMNMPEIYQDVEI